MTTNITRLPAENETMEIARQLHRERCEMPPDAMDMVIAADWKHPHNFGGSVACNRARRAGIEPRLAAVERFDFGLWKHAITAVVAAGFGPFTDGDQHMRLSLEPLERLLEEAETVMEAGRIIRAFKISRDLDYFAYKVVGVLETVVSPGDVARRKSAAQEIARLAGLLAMAGEYKYQDGSYPGYKKEAKWNLEETLAHGWADFRGDLKSVLGYWAGLANQRGEGVPLSEELSLGSIFSWARAELAASNTEEGSNSPNARVWAREGGEIVLSWDGTFTGGRWVKLTLSRAAENSLHCNMQWDSGTGRPSRFLAIESLLALEECCDFGALQIEMIEA